MRHTPEQRAYWLGQAKLRQEMLARMPKETETDEDGGESWEKHCAFEGRMENFV